MSIRYFFIFQTHMTIVVFDNRSTRDTLKASMTTRLINILGGETINVITEGPLPEGTTFLVLSGSSRCISEGEVHLPAVEVIYEAMEKKIPVLGICYGFQILAHVHGYSVERLRKSARTPARRWYWQSEISPQVAS